MSRLARYVQLSLLRGLIVSASMLITLFSLLDFVDQLRFIGHGQYQLVDALRFIALTIPSRIQQLAPSAMLFAGLLALGGLANNGELTALRASGVSIGRIVIWELQLGVLVIIALFLLAEYVIPTSERQAQIGRSNRLEATEIFQSENGFWAQGNHQFLNVQGFTDGVIPTDIDIYAFDDTGRPTRIIHAGRAAVMGGGDWRLSSVVTQTLDSDGLKTQHADELIWPSFLRPEQIQMMLLPAESMAPTDLFIYLRDLKRQNQETARYDQAFWSVLSIPMMLIAMILITPQFLFGSTRSVSIGQRITGGIVLGLVLSLAQQIAKQVGVLFSLSSWLSVCLPPLLLIAVATVMMVRRTNH